jgi:hypothetical protein
MQIRHARRAVSRPKGLRSLSNPWETASRALPFGKSAARHRLPAVTAIDEYGAGDQCDSGELLGAFG